MAGAIAEVTPEAIEQIVWGIVKQFHPQKVILFGSYAYGTPDEDSDVDLLVVMETDGNTLHVAATISASFDHIFPIDILVWKPGKLEESFARRGNFATEVLTRGKVLYEARD
jgi:predicted nucleotidyltransferase